MTEWRKSSYSGGGNDDLCVEVACLDSGIGIRDSKNRDGDHLEFGREPFAALLVRVKRGDLDL